MTPKLSIICLAYNHEKFIRQALDGFVMQKTKFPFEVIVHDDASTDRTPDIIREYAQKYPDIIRPILQTENQFSKGIDVAKHFILPEIRGKYVALCEGDDYWTDENKLQKQVDFLDAHPDVSLCFHPVKVIWEDASQPESTFPTPKMRFNKTTLTIEDLLKHNFIQTNSVVYRWRLKGQEDLIPDGILPGDYFLHLLHAQVGKIAFLPDVMAVYRRNQGGLWIDAGASDVWFCKCAFQNLAFYKAVEKQFHCDKNLEVVDIFSKALTAFLRSKEWEKVQKLSYLYPEIYQSVLKGTSETPSSNKYRQKYKRMKKLVFVLVESLVLCGLYLIFK